VIVEPVSKNASAVILAGGKSSRMGQPKALLPFDHEPLIVHIVRALKSMFAEAVVVAAPDQELPPLSALLVRDEVAYQGPVGGIYYGLKAAGGDAEMLNPPDRGIRGNSHMIMQDKNHLQIADLILQWIDVHVSKRSAGKK